MNQCAAKAQMSLRIRTVLLIATLLVNTAYGKDWSDEI